ncbi:hypothetical protein [Shimia thalassica]|uniref:hypothetical protein n=1 Tax=Shimia thalassica TaxID=1715693 RepID=UPI0026E1C0E2|nr:hypothetical protein [Shimia thalassica]MDO6479131.1 hypothetical protein [Shimia thalassica]
MTDLDIREQIARIDREQAHIQKLIATARKHDAERPEASPVWKKPVVVAAFIMSAGAFAVALWG